jgi:predicted phage-related endonuclease
VALIDGNDFQVRRVERDDSFIALLTEMEAEFWEKYVLGNTAPPVDAAALPAIKARWITVDTQLSVGDPAEIVPLHAAWKAAKAATKDAEVAENLLEAQIREHLAGGEALIAGGLLYATAKQNGTFALKRFAADHPDLADALSTKPTFDLDRVKTEHPELYAQYRARVLRLSATPKEI